MPQLLAALAALTLAALAAAQDSITLRSDASLPPGAPILLRDVAEFSGPSAAALGETVVADAKWSESLGAGRAFFALEADSVKRTLETAAGAALARVSLRGSTCYIKILDPKPRGAGPTPAPAAPAAPTGPTVKDLVPARIAETLGVAAADLRLTYDPASESLLATPVSGRTTELQPAGMSDKLPMTVRVFEGDRIVGSGTVRVTVQVRRCVLITKAAQSRGDILDAADVTTEDRWLGPTAAYLSAQEGVGSAVKNRLSPGQMVTKADIEPAVVVKKGDLVSVTCLAGAISLKTIGRATADGRVGDVLKFESPDDKKRTFRARIAEAGRAVTLAAGSGEPAPAGDAEPAVERGLLDIPPAAGPALAAAAPAIDFAPILKDCLR